MSVHSNNDNLVKGIIVGGLYPRIARIAMPRAQFEKIQQGTIQKDVSCQCPRNTSLFCIKAALHEVRVDPRSRYIA